ncbi:MAG: OsmC family protein [Xanthobacteraceae bacterium]|nr:OsmC family protein [Xanthobacteraceae bacterium]
MSEAISVTITRQDKYKFLVDFGGTIPDAVADLPPPLGDAAGPSPEHLLAAAVANCMASSFVFAHAKFKEDPGPVTATVACQIGRNDNNRVRILGLSVDITLGVAPETLGHLDRTLAQFEEFCTVSQSVKAGIPLSVTVKAPDGRVLKQPA